MKFLTYMKRMNRAIEYSSSIDVSDVQKTAICEILERLNSTHQIAEFTNDMKFDSRYVLYFEDSRSTYRYSDPKILLNHAYDTSSTSIAIDSNKRNSSIFIIRPFVYDGLGVMENEQIILNVYWFTMEEMADIYNKEYIATIRVTVDDKIKTIKVPVSLANKGNISFDISEIDENGNASIPVTGIYGGFTGSFNDLSDFFDVRYTLGEYHLKRKK